jgi:hypothetical protein
VDRTAKSAGRRREPAQGTGQGGRRTVATWRLQRTGRDAAGILSAASAAQAKFLACVGQFVKVNNDYFFEEGFIEEGYSDSACSAIRSDS